jgi:hypothetical protein
MDADKKDNFPELESDCAYRNVEKIKKATNMASIDLKVQECDARDDGFCTGADFIVKKY